ncbi:MAG: DNA-binding response OmpR family regulator [Cellvibrionaceae bacterium]|jgi:DNA-binding response OmpR family regulator
MKILIVDDSRAMQNIVRRGIEQLGYDNMEIRNANNGKEALDIIRVWEPKLILCDWHMPEMSGVELLHSLNRQMISAQIGFVTTETSEARKIEALSAGAKFFVQKPFDYKTLHEAVLPIIQGNSEGETALEEEQHEEHESNHIALPDRETLNTILSTLSKIKLFVEETDRIQLKDHHFPCLIGLFEDAVSKKVRAVAIMDLNGTCILGACVTAIPAERVKEIISQKAVPKQMINNCKSIMGEFCNSLYDQADLKPLKLRSINVMRKNVGSIEKLLSKPAEKRIDIEVAIQGYGSGNLTIVAS